MFCTLFLEKHPESYLKSLRGFRGGGLWRDGRGRPALSAEGGWARRRPSPDEPSGGLESRAPAPHGASLRAVMGGACRAGFLGPLGTTCRLIGEARRSWGTPTWSYGRLPGMGAAGPDSPSPPGPLGQRRQVLTREGIAAGVATRSGSTARCAGVFHKPARFPSKLRGREPLTRRGGWWKCLTEP